MFAKIKKYFEERQHKKLDKIKKLEERFKELQKTCVCSGLPQMGDYEGEVTTCWKCGKKWVWRDGCSVGYWRKK